jgi:hypothetical protein
MWILPKPFEKGYEPFGVGMHEKCKERVDANLWARIKQDWITSAAEWLYKEETRGMQRTTNLLLGVQALGDRPHRHGGQKSTRTWAEMDAADRLPYIIEATNQWRKNQRGKQ